MKLTLGWLKEFVAVNCSAKDLAHRLTMAGLEVEHFEGEGDQTVYTLGITPNRGDCLSILGLARETSALQGKRLSIKPKTPPKGQTPIKDFLKVKVLDLKGAPRYSARIIQGLKIGPSPDWVQKRLLSVGLRPINNVVDATNYVMWEMGQPLHAFDYRFLRGKQIVVKTGGANLPFVTLDGVERRSISTDLFICDGEGPVALAGVMGGANSEVRSDTDTIVLESAYFDPKRIHATAKRLQLTSESSRRFERGIDPNNVVNALHRVTELILETAGGVTTADWIDIYPKKITPQKMSLPISEIERVLGIKLSSSQIQKILGSLGLDAKTGKGNLNILVPTFRPDITRTIDLVEEVARIHGYDNIPATLPQIKTGFPARPARSEAKKVTIDALLRAGYTECCHLSFNSLKKITPFYKTESDLVLLSNPLSEDHIALRPVLTPSLLNALVYNANRQRKNIKLFELKKTFHKSENGVAEKIRLSVVASGGEWADQWGVQPRPVDFFSLKGVLSSVSEALHLKELVFEKENFNFLVSSTSCSVLFQGKKIGWIGLLHPDVLKIWELDADVYAAEIDWQPLADASEAIPIRYQSISKYPFVERDVALVVDNSLSAKKIIQTILKTENPWIKKVQLFDLFTGGNLPANKKSLAFNIHYASHERTLTNEEVNETHQRLIKHLESEIPATLRK